MVCPWFAAHRSDCIAVVGRGCRHQTCGILSRRRGGIEVVSAQGNEIEQTEQGGCDASDRGV